MLTEFAGWWVAQWRALLPAAVAGDGTRSPDALLLAPNGARIDAAVRRRGRTGTLGSFAADAAGAKALRDALGPPPAETALRLPAGALLRRDAILPLAAERDAERVLGYELDRLTPFAVDDVYWAWSVAERDRARNRLTVRLAVLPRGAVAGELESLARIGFRPTRLEADDGAAIGLARQDTRAAQRARLVRRAGWAACAAILLFAAALPFVRQNGARDSVEARIDMLRPQVTLAENLRRRLADEAGGADVVSAERARTGDALRVIALLTDILPDDTWLSDFTLHQGRIGMTGQSNAAAKLIPALAAEPGLRNPVFTAPVTRLDGASIDVFTIRADVAP